LLCGCVSFLTDQLLHSAQPAVAQSLDLRANARQVAGVPGWDRGDSPFQQPPGKVQQKAALEPVSLSLGQSKNILVKMEQAVL